MSTLKIDQYELGGSIRFTRCRMESTSQPVPASVSSTKAATDSSSVAACMVTKDEVCVSIASELPY